MDSQFNPNDWQGRTKEQVESSYQISWLAFTGIITLIVLSLIF